MCVAFFVRQARFAGRSPLPVRSVRSVWSVVKSGTWIRTVLSPMRESDRGEPIDSRAGVRGWLLVLCALLLIGHPLTLGLAASSALDALPLRGLPLALVLALRLVVTAIGIAAGLALLARRAGAVALATIALVASAATDLFVYSTPYYPSNRLPGDTLWYVAASLAYHGLWLGYLYRSDRVRRTY